MKYLLLNSLYRSGKSILQKSLNTHSQVNLVSHGIMPYLMAWNRKFPRESGYPVFAPLCVDYYEPRSFDLELLDKTEFDQSSINALKQLISDSKQFDASRKGVDTESLHTWTDHFESNVVPGSARSILEQLMNSLPQPDAHTEEPMVGFMDQNLHQFLPPLLAGLNTSLYVVNVTRDPRAIAASRNFGNYGTAQGGGKRHPLLLIARMWRTSLQYEKELTNRFPQQFHSLTYENLMSQPEQELPLICDSLGIPIESQMLDPSGFRDESGKQWDHNSSFGFSDGFDPSTSDRWKQNLPEEYLAAIEFLLFHEMQEFGYEPVTSAKDSLKAFTRFSEDPSELSDWTLGTDLILDEVQKTREIERHHRVTEII